MYPWLEKGEQASVSQRLNARQVMTAAGALRLKKRELWPFHLPCAGVSVVTFVQGEAWMRVVVVVSEVKQQTRRTRMLARVKKLLMMMDIL